MGYRELPRVDPLRCTSSGDCVHVCPTACLDLLGLRDGLDLPILARPHECVSCTLCVAVCPVEAIRMESRWDSAS